MKLTRKTRLLLLPLLFCISTLYLEVDALASDQPLLVKMSREVWLSGYGHLLLNDYIVFINNSTTPIRLPQFTTLYPTEEMDYQVNHPLEKGWVRVDRLGNVSSITITADLTIPPSSNLTVELRTMLGGLVKPLGGDRYEVAIPIPSSPDTTLGSVELQASLPIDVKPQSIPEGFEQRQGAEGDVLYAKLVNLQPTSEPSTAKLVVNASSYAFTVLTVDRQDRLVKILSPSEVIVFDSVSIKNEGTGTLYSLKTSLGEHISSVILSRGDIPLRDQKRISLIGGALDFYSLIGGDLKTDERLSFTISYRLTTISPSSYNTLLLEIPVTPLVKDALVKEYHLTTEAPRGYFTEAASIALNYASTLNSEKVNVSMRIGSAWASTYAFPIATLIFIASFITLSAYIAHRRREAEAYPLLELVDLYENALQSQEAIADAVSAGRPERTRIAQIDLFTQQLKEIRAKTASKAAQIRGKMPTDSKVEQKLTQFNTLDKVYERALLDLLSAYKSYLTGKMKREAFEKTVSDKTRTIQKLASSLREVLDEVRRI